ncbi:MAG: beta-ketoacyl-[acyl-carrier-protein] synthase family protein [Candidatus Rokubacteria bacterium]|nr:beta-ketoacyl-[acyl-carrier-protein] synthase family protein [Candidatus Rokubacteria bacterium]
MNRRRVVITGLGVVAPNGIGKDQFWRNLVAGHSAVDYITAFDPSPYPCKVAAEVRNFNPADFMHPRRVKHRGRFSQFAVAAAKLALEDSGIVLTQESAERVMVCVGTSANGVGDVYEAARIGFQHSGVSGIPEMSGIEYPAHAPVGHVSMELGIRGQAMTLASACTTGLDAVQWGYSQTSDGHADVVFAGSTEAPISPLCFATFCASGTLSKFDDPPTRGSRPYDLRRDGIVLGEGSAVCVLEDMEHAIARRATVYAEVLGFGTGNEGGYGSRIDAGELALTEAIHTALVRASLGSTLIDFINSHGNALPDYDLVETRAFKRAFGEVAYNIPVSSIKSMIGHAMGAASSLQIASACLTLQQSVIPPTINLETPDPECDLDYVPNQARVSRVRNVLINAHAMGGTHSVLILGHSKI